MKPCPFCQKEIQDDAKICRYCRQKLDAVPQNAVPELQLGKKGEKTCPACGQTVKAEAKICRFCKHRFNPAGESEESGVLGRLHEKLTSPIPCQVGWGIFMAANAAAMVVLFALAEVLQLDLGLAGLFLLLLIGAGIPYGMLYFSKALVKWQYDLKEIDPENPGNDTQKYICEVISLLSQRAGLEKCPEIYFYQSEEMNAFATGASRNDSLIAFSSSIMDKMSRRDLAAVAGHEMAHIANGDMQTMTLLQGLVNSAVIMIDFALAQSDALEALRKRSKFVSFLVRFAIVNILMLAGNLIMLWFSRKREFAADATSAKLFSRDAMIGALQTLERDPCIGKVTEAGDPAAAMMISAPAGWTDVFSTHPATERRIAALKEVRVEN